MRKAKAWGGCLALLVASGPVFAQTPPADTPTVYDAAGASGQAPAAAPPSEPAAEAVPPASAAPQALPAAPVNAAPEPAATPAPEPPANAAAPSEPQAPASATAPSGDNPNAAAASPPPAAAPPPPPPEPTLIASVDLDAQRVTITENGVKKHTWPISSGTRGYRTKTGTFTATWTSRMHYSRQWDWAPMPYAVFFNRGTAFHGTYATRRLGSPASHGCIRLTTANARTLYNLVHKHGTRMTRVIVRGTPNFNEPQVAERRRSSRNASRYARRGYGRYAYSDPYYYAPPPRRRRYVERRYVDRPIYQGPFGGLWD